MGEKQKDKQGRRMEISKKEKEERRTGRTRVLEIRKIRKKEKERRKKTGRTRRAGRTRRTRRRARMVVIRTRTRRDAVERAPTCCLSLFTTSSGASTWPWNRHLRSVSKTSSLTEKDRAAGDLRENRFGIYKLVVHS